MNPFNSAAVCLVVVVVCGCDRGQPTPPVASNPTPDPTPVEDMELPESTNSIGMKFKLIPAGTFTMGEDGSAFVMQITQPFKIGVHEVTQ